MSTIKVKCIDQTLTIVNAPVIASGGLLENDVEFDFCPLWTGYLKTAVFYKDKNLVYSAVIGTGTKCTIPHEVTDDPGTMYFGVYGVNEDEVTRTSEILKYNIVQGALNENTKPSDPTADFWQQCLAKVYEAISIAENVGDTADTANQNSSSALAMAETHASRHATDGEDPITPDSIGAAASDHKHTTSDITNFPSTMKPAAHAHGNITNSGKIGTEGGKVITTDENGTLQAQSKEEVGIKPSVITETGEITATLADNTEYFFGGVTSLNIVGAGVDCHGFVVFPAETTPTINISEFEQSAGDDITAIGTTAAVEVWEFSVSHPANSSMGFIIWKNWSEI